MFQNLTFLGLIQRGGATEVVLIAFSVLSIAIMLQRAWVYRKFKKAVTAFSPSLRSVLSGNGLKAAVNLSSSDDSPLARIFLAGAARQGRPKEDISGAMELAARTELARIERFLGVLGTIGSTAPFIGLFGTVLGIIRAFSDLAAAQGASPAAVADGIAEALVATATGLFVAVPAVMAYNYFVRTSSKYALELENEASHLIDAIADGADDGVEA